MGKKKSEKKHDVSKQVWKFQEGAVFLALSAIIGDKSSLHWNHDKSFTPNGMSIDPDLVIAKDPDAPKLLVFVTHAAAEMASQKKFWRTVPEVIEAKRLASNPKVVSVLFAGNVKADLKIAYTLLFDGVCHLDARAGIAFSESLHDLTKKHGAKTPQKCLDILESATGRLEGWPEFCDRIKSLYKSKRGPLDAVMSSSEFQMPFELPEAKTTSLRRSVCRLFTLQDDAVSLLFKGEFPEQVPSHSLFLNWFKEGITGEAEFYDLDGPNELQEFLSTAREADVKYIIAKARRELPNFCEYGRRLNSVSNRSACYEWISENYESLTTKARMMESLNLVYSDPYSPLVGRLEKDEAPTDHWLFNSMMIILRSETGNKDGYGYSGLSKDTGIVEIAAHPGVLITPYIQRERMLSASHLSKISDVFAKHLVRLGAARVKELGSRSAKVECESTFRFQMMNYQLFNPIDWLVIKHLKRFGINCETGLSHPSFISEKLESDATRTSNILYVKEKNVWIKCQSAYNGRIDKRKELCGRIGAMKLSYSPEAIGKVRFFLVIDGFFTKTDLELLQRAGWDGIFYYDELENLREAIEL